MSSAARRCAALGFAVRTGRAVVVGVGGPTDAPEVLAKAQIAVATRFEEGAVFHVAQELPIEEARGFVSAAEDRFGEQARAALAAFRETLDARVVAAAMAAPDAKRLPPLDAILKSHPLVHAAEGELYRRVFAEASAAIGLRPARVPPDALAGRVAESVGLAPARVAAHLAAMGKASGRPWAADQKRAALAAWLALASA